MDSFLSLLNYTPQERSELIAQGVTDEAGSVLVYPDPVIQISLSPITELAIFGVGSRTGAGAGTFVQIPTNEPEESTNPIYESGTTIEAVTINYTPNSVVPIEDRSDASRKGSGTASGIDYNNNYFNNIASENEERNEISANERKNTAASASYVLGLSIVSNLATTIGVGSTIAVAGLTAGLVFLTGDSDNLVLENRNKDIESDIVGLTGVVTEHLNKLEGFTPGSGNPNDPWNKDKWKKDIMRAINNIKKELGKFGNKKMNRSWEDVLRKRGFTQEEINNMTRLLQKHGIKELP